MLQQISGLRDRMGFLELTCPSSFDFVNEGKKQTNRRKCKVFIQASCTR
jgi:hypothetical protein